MGNRRVESGSFGTGLGSSGLGNRRRLDLLLVALAAAGSLGLAGANLAFAQASFEDHLKCYKVKDSLKLRATAALDTTRFGADAGCSIGKAKLFCTPSTKVLAEATNQGTKSPIDALPVAAPAAPAARICYKVKCPATPPDQASLNDQFGTHALSKFKTSFVCTPATEASSVVFDGFEVFPFGPSVLDVVEGPDASTLKTGNPLHQEQGNTQSNPLYGLETSFSPPDGPPPVLISSWGAVLEIAAPDDEILEGDFVLVSTFGEAGGAPSDLPIAAARITFGPDGAAAIEASLPAANASEQTPPLRTAEVFCGETSVATVADATPDDEMFTWRASEPPNSLSATHSTDDGVVQSFTWTQVGGCFSIGDEDGNLYQGDRVVISARVATPVDTITRLRIAGADTLRKANVVALTATP